MDITDEFIKKILNILPPEGLGKLNSMIDNNEISEQTIESLLAEYGIDKVAIVKEIQGESQNESRD
ncbi:MAG: hypothetical protein Q4A36_03970 [Candidatus Saccharibacteria bacterium]|nr:hypothetical protein [Candidatus Saccharibacteria bacterium]